MLLESKVFNISIISETADFELFKRFGFQSGREVNKFQGYGKIGLASNGITYIKDGTNAYISGTVYDTVDLGTHTLFICDVTDMELIPEADGSVARSATYEYYQENIKPKPQDIKKGDEIGSLVKDEDEKGQTVWVCKVCGYVYEGEDLPEDFICPWCKHPASDFEKVVR